MRSFRALAALLVAGLLMILADAIARAIPPESKGRESIATGQSEVVQDQEAAAMVSEADRKIAYFQFEILSWLALQCPSPLQQEMIHRALVMRLHSIATEGDICQNRNPRTVSANSPASIRHSSDTKPSDRFYRRRSMHHVAEVHPAEVLRD